MSDLDTELTNATQDIKKSGQAAEDQAVDEKSLVEEAPIIKVVAVILRHAVEGAASDIHILKIQERM